MAQDREKPRRRATDKLFAEWFWTDRWTNSRGHTMPMEARGLYREMLTQAWMRGAKLPNDYEQIQLVCACNPKVWRRCWPLVQPFWMVDGDWLVNATQVDVYKEAKDAQARAQARAQAGARAMHERRLTKVAS